MIKPMVVLGACIIFWFIVVITLMFMTNDEADNYSAAALTATAMTLGLLILLIGILG